MEQVLKLCVESFQGKAENTIFWKLVILTSLMIVFARDTIIYIQISRFSEEYSDILRYYTTFYYVQIIWLYVPWVMLSIMFYPVYGNIPYEF